METGEESKHPDGVDLADGRSTEAANSDAATAEAVNPEVVAPESPEGAEADAQADTAEAAPEESELEKAQREVAELKDSWNRERADFANFRKRSVAERSRAQGEAVARFTRELLDVMDNLDRVLSIQSDNDEVKNFITGVEMIRTSFAGVFQNNSVRVANPEGEAFNPQTMEAIAREERADLTQDTVVEVYQAGYTIELAPGEVQTLRPARVKVGVAPKAAAGSDAPEGEAEEATDAG